MLGLERAQVRADRRRLLRARGLELLLELGDLARLAVGATRDVEDPGLLLQDRAEAGEGRQRGLHAADRDAQHDPRAAALAGVRRVLHFADVAAERTGERHRAPGRGRERVDVLDPQAQGRLVALEPSRTGAARAPWRCRRVSRPSGLLRDVRVRQHSTSPCLGVLAGTPSLEACSARASVRRRRTRRAAPPPRARARGGAKASGTTSAGARLRPERGNALAQGRGGDGPRGAQLLHDPVRVSDELKRRHRRSPPSPASAGRGSAGSSRPSR